MSSYVREKLKILKELKISLSPAQIQYIQSLDNEIQVDNYTRDIIVTPVKMQLVYR